MKTSYEHISILLSTDSDYAIHGVLRKLKESFFFLKVDMKIVIWIVPDCTTTETPPIQMESLSLSLSLMLVTTVND